MLYHITTSPKQHHFKTQFFFLRSSSIFLNFFLKWANSKLVKTTTFFKQYIYLRPLKSASCGSNLTQYWLKFQYFSNLSWVSLDVADIWLMLLCCGCYVGENFVNMYGTDVKNWKKILIGCFGHILGNMDLTVLYRQLISKL